MDPSKKNRYIATANVRNLSEQNATRTKKKRYLNYVLDVVVYDDVVGDNVVGVDEVVGVDYDDGDEHINSFNKRN